MSQQPATCPHTLPHVPSPATSLHPCTRPDPLLRILTPATCPHTLPSPMPHAPTPCHHPCHMSPHPVTCLHTLPHVPTPATFLCPCTRPDPLLRIHETDGFLDPKLWGSLNCTFSLGPTDTKLDLFWCFFLMAKG